MRRTKRPSIARLAVLLLTALLAGQFRLASVAADASGPSLVISQLKITSSSGQFITLYNATNTALDLGKYQLEYFNNYDLAKATSSRLISLTGLVPPHGYYMVNDSSQLLCYQLTVDSVSLGLSSTAGLVEVLAYNQAGPGGSASPTLLDFVGWSKTAAAGAQTLPSSTSAFLQRLPVDANNNPSVPSPGGGSWQSVQPGSANPCNLVLSSTSAPVQSGYGDLLPATEPAASFADSAAETPATYHGQMAPLITEVLPNPAGSGNDAVDEFIEVYNPNPTDFDLGGFSLQASLSSLHNYKVPDNTILAPQSFTTFYSSTTHLSLSNSGGQLKLLDPTGKTISTSPFYGTAGDGQAWALANGKWYWTLEPTPGEPNIIKTPASTTKAAVVAKAKATKAAESKTKAGKSKAAKAGRATKAKKAKVKTKAKLASETQPASANPIRTSTIAVVVGLALLYGAYEYRADIQNGFHRLRRQLGFGRGSRT